MTGFPGTGDNQPKYAAMMTAMKAHKIRMNLPWVIR